MDGQTLFHRTLPGTGGVSKKVEFHTDFLTCFVLEKLY